MNEPGKEACVVFAVGAAGVSPLLLFLIPLHRMVHPLVYQTLHQWHI